MSQDSLAKTIDENSSDLKQSSEPVDSHYEYCSNCGVRLAGLYCHQCGQSSKSMIKFFGEVVRELLDDTIGYDSRVKHSIMPLLFKPGKITLDYIKGKRFYYVLPFRLYLITSLVLILLVQASVDTNELKFNEIVKVNGDQESVQELQKEINQEVNQELDELNKTLNQAKTKDKTTAKNGQQPKDSSADSASNRVAQERPTQEKTAEEKPASRQSENESESESESKADSQPSLKVGSDDESINLNWNEETQQLEGVDDLSEGVLKTFLVVINPKIKNWREDPKPIIDEFFEALPFMMFVILPIFAIFLKVFYAFSKRYYVEHLVFLLHNHSFIYLVMMIEIITEFFAVKLANFDNGLANVTAVGLHAIGKLLFYWTFIYVFLAMKRFYRQGWFLTFFKTISLGAIYSVLILMGFVLTLAYGAYSA